MEGDPIGTEGCGVVDMATHRRRSFEARRSEEELAVIDFDEFGQPKPLELGPGCREMLRAHRRAVRLERRGGVVPKEEHVDATLTARRMLEPVAATLIQMDPGLARSLGLFPRLRLVDDIDEGVAGEEEAGSPEAQDPPPVL